MKILVIIPVYNKAATLYRAVDSVLKQDTDNYQILIIDDGSTDGSATIAKDFESDKVQVIYHDSNQGVSAARNKGLEYAQKEGFKYVVLLDADDYWQPNHLSNLLQLAEKFPNHQAFATNYILKRPRKTYKTKFSNLTEDQEQSLEFFFTNNFLNPILTCSTLMIETAALEKVGLFNTKYTHFEDIDWFIRLGMHAPVAFSKKMTVIVDETAQNRSDRIFMSHRRYPDFDAYDQHSDSHEGLGKYLSLNRYAISLAYRMENDIKNATRYKHAIQMEHLNRKQSKLINMSRLQLKSLKKTQRVLGNLGFHLRAGE